MDQMELENAIYPPVIEYLKSKHKTLKDDYCTEDGKSADTCTLFACDVAKLVKQGGEKPFLIGVRGNESGWTRNKLLEPKIYKGRVSWSGHVVCAVGDMVLDPIVGKPLRVDEYRREVFTQPINLEVAIPEEFMDEFLQIG